MFAAKAREPVKVQFPPWGLFVLESHHARDFRMPMTAHDFFKVMFVLAGAGHVRTPQTSHPIRKGDVIVVPKGFRHCNEDDANRALSLIVLCVRQPAMERIAALGDAQKGWDQFAILRNGALTLETRRTLRQLLFEQTLHRPGCATIMTGCALQLLGSIMRLRAVRAEKRRAIAAVPRDAGAAGESAPETRVRAHLAELEHNFSGNDKIDTVAARLGISRRYFTRLVRKISGRSWLDHVKAVRLRHACALLERTSRSIVAVAFECGFDDLSTFYRAFKSSKGVTPLQWRTDRRR